MISRQCSKIAQSNYIRNFYNVQIRSITDIVSGGTKGQGSSDRTFVRGYGDHAFQINDTLVRNSVILLPTSYFIWKALKFEDINEESLSIFPLLFPTIEMVLIGCGDTVPNRLPVDLVKKFRSQGIVLEAMTSNSAISTFNVLNGEGRNVGAAVFQLKGPAPFQEVI